MAGAGRRTFSPGEVLTASNVMSYLQDQAVMNFAGTAARGSAIGTAVSEGMVSYLADSNIVEIYDGSAWRQISATTGNVLQVVSTTKKDTFTASVGGGAETEITGLTVSITPKSTNSKILVTASVSLGSIADQNGVYISLFRSTTAIGQGDASGNRQTVTSAAYGVPAGAAGTEAIETISANFLDTPATTSSTTYSIKMSHARGATQTMYVNRALVDSDQSYEARAVSTITVMEIAG